MKISVHSMYTGTEYQWDNVSWFKLVSDEECDIICYTDIKIPDVLEDTTGKPKIAIMIEPRMFEGHKQSYDFLDKNYEMFDYIFTHDSILLKNCPNARLMYWGSVWGWSDEEKTKNVSMISSEKQYCDLHKKRFELVNYLDSMNLADCYGTWNGGSYIDTLKAHSAYKFAIAIENYVDDYWFTEKILNCFSNKVVPIYYGAKRIGDFFDINGIIIIDNIDDIPNLLKTMDFDFEYRRRYAAIKNNYKKVSFFGGDFWDRFYLMFHKDLEKILN